MRRGEKGTQGKPERNEGNLSRVSSVEPEDPVKGISLSQIRFPSILLSCGHTKIAEIRD